MIGIMGKEKNQKRFKPYDYNGMKFTTNVIFQTLWDSEHKEHVQGLIDYMNEHNPNYVFKMIKRT